MISNIGSKGEDGCCSVKHSIPVLIKVTEDKEVLFICRYQKTLLYGFNLETVKVELKERIENEEYFMYVFLLYRLVVSRGIIIKVENRNNKENLRKTYKSI